jgi:O-acetylserine/cysteine efflux transporter
MRPRDFVLLFGICVVWGLNFVVTKWIVAGDPSVGYLGLPPMFAMALRFTLASVALAPFLRPVPQDLTAVALVALVFGAMHFGFIHLGMLTASPSAASIAIQLLVPFTAILSVLILKERIGPPRIIGIALAFFGVILIAFDPHTLALSIGVAYVAAGAFCAAWGAILVKRLKQPIGAINLQAWIVVLSTPMLLAASFSIEHGQIEGLLSGGWRLALAQLFVVGGVTLFAHTGYVWLLRRYEASFLSPLTLMSPVWGVIFGVTLMGDPLTVRFLVGAAMALVGVGVVVVRSARKGAPTPPAADAPPTPTTVEAPVASAAERT